MINLKIFETKRSCLNSSDVPGIFFFRGAEKNYEISCHCNTHPCHDLKQVYLNTSTLEC